MKTAEELCKEAKLPEGIATSERDVLYIHRRFMIATTGPMGKKL